MADDIPKRKPGRPKRLPSGVDHAESWRHWRERILKQGRQFVTADLHKDTVDFILAQREPKERIGETIERLLRPVMRKRK
jgi:hypothetical protein